MNKQWRELISSDNTSHVDQKIYKFKLPYFISDGELSITHISIESPICCDTKINLYKNDNCISETKLEDRYNSNSGVSLMRHIHVNRPYGLDNFYCVIITFPSKNHNWCLCVDFAYEHNNKPDMCLESKIDESLFPTPINVLSEEPQKHFDCKTTYVSKYKKTQIPKTVKCKVWDIYIGKEQGVGKCYVCEDQIDSKHFECGHIIAERMGGETTIENLRPVCSLCNKSVNTKNMKDFKCKYF
jgi:hypothetical protein